MNIPLLRILTIAGTVPFSPNIYSTEVSAPTELILGHPPTIDSIALYPYLSNETIQSGTTGLSLETYASDLENEPVSLVYAWYTVTGTTETEIKGQTTDKLTIPVPDKYGSMIMGCAIPTTNPVSTMPSHGLRRCASATIIPPAPTISDLKIIVPDGSDSLIVGGKLSGQYTWSKNNKGEDISRYTWGKRGLTASNLVSATSAQPIELSGSVPELTITNDYLGDVIELSVLPVTSTLNRIGVIHTTNTDDTVIDKDAKPVVNDFTPEWVGSRSVNMQLPSSTFTLSSGGGYTVTKARYEVILGQHVLSSGILTNNTIPTTTIPASLTDAMLGNIYYYITPINTKGVEGIREGRRIGVLVDSGRPIETTSLIVSTSDDFPAIGSKISATYSLNAHGNYGGDHSVYAWRYKANDTSIEKENYLKKYGSTLRAESEGFSGKIPPRQITSVDAGRVIELLFQPSLRYSLAPNTKEVKGVIKAIDSGKINGSLPSFDPNGVPSIKADSIKLTSWRYWINSDLIYDFKANGGNPYDTSEFTWKIIKDSDKTIFYSSQGKAMYNGHAPASLVVPTTPKNDYLTAVLSIKPMNGNGLSGNLVTITSRDMRLGPGGLGYIYHRTKESHPPIYSGNIKFNLPEKLTVGQKISATYTPNVFKGAEDASKISWMGLAETSVERSGMVPEYTIRPEDIGKKISLSIRNCDFGVLMPNETPRVLSCSNATTIVTSDYVSSKS
ncbi:hypothetical protein JD508_15360 [Aeromonas jandaei]|uniref:hypothetical protein n=1 Tax=Aeromonas jandaei TaxID=650 RepID=UPI00191EA7BB|nr:hypothetical protein [Aeromonas jandaei]MBL0611617.1 hypothetical protein [Aeromonas jandaei]